MVGPVAFAGKAASNARQAAAGSSRRVNLTRPLDPDKSEPTKQVLFMVGDITEVAPGLKALEIRGAQPMALAAERERARVTV